MKRVTLQKKRIAAVSAVMIVAAVIAPSTWAAVTASFVPPCTTTTNSCLDKRVDSIEGWINAQPSPTPTTSTTTTATATTTATPTTSTTTTATPTTSATTTAASTGFPDASTTGVPSGTTLTTHTGPLVVTTANTVIDSKTITGTLEIRAAGVVVKNSVVNGNVWIDHVTYPTAHLDISDSEIRQPMTMGSGLDGGNYVATRLEITGGNRSAWCMWQCTIQDSYVHGQFTDAAGRAHESGIRVEAYSTIRHNTIACTAPIVPPDAGCSADLTGYPDFAVIQHNTIDGNLFKAAPDAALCGYFGNTAGKAYSGQTHHITVTNNVFEISSNGHDCGLYGTTTDFPTGDANSVWTNNRIDNGTLIPANW